MDENNTPNQVQDEENTPLVVPSHDPLPPPPEIHFTRPLPENRAASRGSLSSEKNGEVESQSAAGHGAGMAAGLSFITSILAGLLAGNWLDQHYIHSSTPWATMGMTLVGTAVGFTNMSRLMSRGGRRKP